MANIFISYKSSERDKVKALADDIEAIDHEVWFDKELTGGHLWWDSILEQIRECDIFIYALSPASLDSYPCELERRYAYALQKRILPVLIVDGVRTNLLPPELSSIQFVDYRQADKNSALRLARALANLPPPRPLPEQMPEAPATPLSPLAQIVKKLSSEASLDFERQTTIVFQLQEALGKSDTYDDALELLRRLRRRDDVVFRVAERIDTIIEDSNIRKRPAIRPAPQKQVPSSSKIGDIAQKPKQTKSPPRQYFQEPKQREYPSTGVQVQSVSLFRPHWRLMLNSAFVCAIIGPIVLWGQNYYSSSEQNLLVLYQIFAFALPWLAQGIIAARYIGDSSNRGFWWYIRSGIMGGLLNFLLVRRIYRKWLWLNILIVIVGWPLAFISIVFVTFFPINAVYISIDCYSSSCQNTTFTFWLLLIGFLGGGIGAYFTGIAINRALRAKARDS